LIKNLYDRGLDGEQVRLLFKYIDWMMDLPAELKEALSVELQEFEKEQQMPFVSPMERFWEARGIAKGEITGREEGKIEGREEGRLEGKIEGKIEDLLQLLAVRFERLIPVELEQTIRAASDVAQLQAWFHAGLKAKDLAEFRRLSGV
jgi:hypothetical protein